MQMTLTTAKIDQLAAALAAADEANARLVAIKAQILADLVDADVPTVKVPWGQIQRVREATWTYRDRAVTEGTKELQKAETEVAKLRKLLKGYKEAARAAGKAKQGDVSFSLRIVRGDKG